MRGIYNSVTDIRRNVFTEIARLAYEGGDYASSIEKLPFKIIPGERATYRDSIFLERAIVGERLRLGIGLPVRRMDEHSSLSDGIEESAIAEKYYDDPLVNVIKFACNACPEKTVVVTDTCQGLSLIHIFFSTSHASSFSTPNACKSSTDVMEAPSISVAVSFPPINIGATTISI